MKVEVRKWEKSAWNAPAQLSDAQLVIYFAGRGLLDSGDRFLEIKSSYPTAHIIGCSTGGEIFADEVLDGTVCVAAIRFRATKIKAANINIENMHDSFNAGKSLAHSLAADELRNVFILSEGMKVNGSELVRGIYEVLGKDVIVTGGMAGDGDVFQKTLVGVDALPKPNQIAAIGFYGNSLNVGYGSVGGWNAFGPKRLITKSRGNVLYELDGKPALELYKLYLGSAAEKLPSSALLFPLGIHPTDDERHSIVRTVVSVDEKEKTMTFAGDIPEGHIAQLMRGDFDNLIEGAAEAARLSNLSHPKSESLAILVSCIGRKLLLGQHISDETEAVADVFGHTVPTIGFYSYGEICHQQFTGECGLHNQTMTVTLLYEPE